MKRRIITLAFFCITSGILINGAFNKAYTYTSGSPSLSSGAPAESNCTSCHRGSAVVPETGWITSDIDTNGYVPGNTYTITATIVNRSGVSGFQVSPRNSKNAGAGKCIITNSAQTGLATSGTKQFVNHTNLGSSLKTWSFNWTAPVAGTGNVTFYGAFNEANGNGSSSGDIIHTSTLKVKENVPTGIADLSSNRPEITIFPNPVTDHINVDYTLNRPSKVDIILCDILGQELNILYSKKDTEGAYHNRFDIADLPNGTYFIQTKIDNSVIAKRVIISK